MLAWPASVGGRSRSGVFLVDGRSRKWWRVRGGRAAGGSVKIDVDFAPAAHPGSSSAVAASHQVGQFAFDLGSSGPIVGGPVGIVLLTAGVGRARFVATDPSAATALSSSAF